MCLLVRHREFRTKGTRLIDFGHLEEGPRPVGITCPVALFAPVRLGGPSRTPNCRYIIMMLGMTKTDHLHPAVGGMSLGVDPDRVRAAKSLLNTPMQNVGDGTISCAPRLSASLSTQHMVQKRLRGGRGVTYQQLRGPPVVRREQEKNALQNASSGQTFHFRAGRENKPSGSWLCHPCVLYCTYVHNAGPSRQYNGQINRSTARGSGSGRTPAAPCCVHAAAMLCVNVVCMWRGKTGDPHSSRVCRRGSNGVRGQMASQLVVSISPSGGEKKKAGQERERQTNQRNAGHLLGTSHGQVRGAA